MMQAAKVSRDFDYERTHLLVELIRDTERATNLRAKNREVLYAVSCYNPSTCPIVVNSARGVTTCCGQNRAKMKRGQRESLFRAQLQPRERERGTMGTGAIINLH